MKKTLYLLRHAKSEWHSDAPTDFQRPLNSRGQKNAAKMGAWLLENNLVPNAVVSSPALRAWQTATQVCYILGIDESEIFFDSHLYMASVEDLLEVIGELPAQAKSVMIIGHNPGLEELLVYLVGDDISMPADYKLFPTAAFAHLELQDGWQTPAAGSAKLVSLVRVKEI